MNTFVIGENIRRLRAERIMTQQQLADAIGVSFQAVSKWENGASLPDVATLPQIADYFEVTIDSLYRPNMTVYKNKAQRLMTTYECDQDNTEAFDNADAEYKRLFSSKQYDVDDISSYAYLNDCRARFYVRVAEQYYCDAIALGAVERKDSYYKDLRQYIVFLSRLGRSQESIQRHTQLLEQEPDNVMNYSSLFCAYQCAGDHVNALGIAEEGLQRFPDDPLLLVFAGDACNRLGRSDDAVVYWDRSFFKDPEMIDTRYSLAEHLMDQGRNEEAEKVWEQIIAWNQKRGYEVESKWVQAKLDKLRKDSNP